MIIWPILGLLLFAFMLVWRYKREKERSYHHEQARLDVARAKAIESGNIFSKKNLKQVEAHLRATRPDLNRHQVRERALKVGELFVSRVKAGLE
jgi:hypothetical protein